jgi:hypothetical protein
VINDIASSSEGAHLKRSKKMKTKQQEIQHEQECIKGVWDKFKKINAVRWAKNEFKRFKEGKRIRTGDNVIPFIKKLKAFDIFDDFFQDAEEYSDIYKGSFSRETWMSEAIPTLIKGIFMFVWKRETSIEWIKEND